MGVHVDDVVGRIMAVDWKGSHGRARSRAYLMKEYLRRAAWWAKVTRSEPLWPFFDIAAAVDPATRADPAAVERVQALLRRKLQGVPVTRACVRALHFAALFDERVALPQAPPHPFEPLMLLFERGGGFQVEGSGLIDVDTIGVSKGSLQGNLRPDPITQLDDTTLDALD